MARAAASILWWFALRRPGLLWLALRLADALFWPPVRRMRMRWRMRQRILLAEAAPPVAGASGCRLRFCRAAVARPAVPVAVKAVDQVAAFRAGVPAVRVADWRAVPPVVAACPAVDRADRPAARRVHPADKSAAAPMPTFDGPPGPQSSSSNKSGPPPIDPGEGPPPGPPTPIRQRPGNLPPDNSQKFERQQPTGSLEAPSSLDMSQATADPVGVVVRRYFRQTASAGFRTHVAVAQSERTASRSAAARARASRDFEEPRIVARTD